MTTPEGGTDILATIVAQRVLDVKESKSKVSLEQLKAQLAKEAPQVFFLFHPFLFFLVLSISFQFHNVIWFYLFICIIKECGLV